MPQDFVDSRETTASIFAAPPPPQLIVNTPRTSCHTLSRSRTMCSNVRRRYRRLGLKHISVSMASQTDKLFLLVSALREAHDSKFKGSTLKRSVCLLLSRSIRQRGRGCCQELFGDDAQALCRRLLSQHIHQLLHKEGNNAAAGKLGGGCHTTTCRTWHCRNICVRTDKQFIHPKQQI